MFLGLFTATLLNCKLKFTRRILREVQAICIQFWKRAPQLRPFVLNHPRPDLQGVLSIRIDGVFIIYCQVRTFDIILGFDIMQRSP